MKRNNKKGFTIVELVIVIAVIAILAGVMIPTFGAIIDNANESRAIQEGKNALTAKHAEDLEDGIVDNLVDSGITYEDGVITGFTYTCENGYTATYADGEWTATKTTNP